MLPTQILSHEHRVIEVVLTCLDKMTDQALAEKKLDADSARQAVDFIRTFADRCHHAKEENQLFETLAKKGMPREGGPVGQMINEHEQGREFVRGMDENIVAASSGDNDALARFAENARGYTALLRSHIMKEDRVLYPMANRILTDDDQSQLLTDFETVESEHMGAGTHEKYLAIAETLADKFGVEKDAIKAGACACGH